MDRDLPAAAAVVSAAAAVAVTAATVDSGHGGGIDRWKRLKYALRSRRAHALPSMRPKGRPGLICGLISIGR